MSSLYKTTNAAGQPLNTLYAQDIAQFVDVLTGQRDGGALSLLAPLASPTSAPAVTTSAGSLTGTYKWQVYWISGIMDGTDTASVNGRTPAGPATSGTALSSQQATLDISGLTAPTGVIGWGVARTHAGGSTFLLVPGSEQFLSAAGSLPATFVDNTADGSLVTAVQTVNTTGTTLRTSGYEWDRAKITSSVSVTTANTSESTAIAVVTGNSVTYDGTEVKIEFFCERFDQGGHQPSLGIFRDGSCIADFGGYTSASAWAMKLELFDTPTAGAHTYAVKMWDPLGVTGGVVHAGPGGAGQSAPAFLRVTKA